jgi:hypothetical protein
VTKSQSDNNKYYLLGIVSFDIDLHGTLHVKFIFQVAACFWNAAEARSTTALQSGTLIFTTRS